MSWAMAIPGAFGAIADMFGGKGAANAANQATQQQQQEWNAIQSLVNQTMTAADTQYNKFDVPAMAQSFPNMEATISGRYSPMMAAAQAPVMAQGSRDLEAIKAMLGGVTNPNQLLQSVSRTNTQNAGLAADSTIGTAMSGLLNMIGQGTNFLQNASTSGENALGNIASGLGYRAAQDSQTAANDFAGIGTSLGSSLGALFGPGGMFGGGGGSSMPASQAMPSQYQPTLPTSAPLPTDMPLPYYPQTAVPSVGIAMPTIGGYNFPANSPGALPGNNDNWGGNFNPPASAIPSWMNALPGMGGGMPPAS